MSGPGPGAPLDADGTPLITRWVAMSNGVHVHRRGPRDTVTALPAHTHHGQGPHTHDAHGMSQPAPDADEVHDAPDGTPILALPGHLWEAEAAGGDTRRVRLDYDPDLVALIRRVARRNNLRGRAQVVITHVGDDTRAEGQAHTLDTLPGLSQAARAVILAAVREGAGLWRLPRYVEIDVLVELSRHRLITIITGAMQGTEPRYYLSDRGMARRGPVLARYREDAPAYHPRDRIDDDPPPPYRPTAGQAVDLPTPAQVPSVFSVCTSSGVELPLTPAEYRAVDSARDEPLINGEWVTMVPIDTADTTVTGLLRLGLLEAVIAGTPPDSTSARYALTRKGLSAHYTMRQTSGGDRPPPPPTGG